MLCVADIPPDGPGWAEVAECLDKRRLYEAANQARRRAWASDPSLGDRLAGPALTFAHRTGDDGLLADIARTMADIDDADIDGHYRLAQAVAGSDDERRWLDGVEPGSCQYVFAQYRLAAHHGAAGRSKSEVVALRDVIESAHADHPEDWGRGVQWQVWNLADVARIQVASVYAGHERFDHAEQYARPVADGASHVAPYGRYITAWAAEMSGDADAASKLAAAASALVPEAYVLLASTAEPEARVDLAAAAHARWDPVRAQLSAYTVEYAEKPAEARRGLLALDLPEGAMESAGAASASTPLWQRTLYVAREARRARRNDTVAGLVADARTEIETALGESLLAQAAHAVDRIDAALEGVDHVGTREIGPPWLPWSAADFGWTDLPVHAPVVGRSVPRGRRVYRERGVDLLDDRAE